MTTTGGIVSPRLTVASATGRHETARILNPDDPATEPASRFHSPSDFSRMTETAVVSYQFSTHRFKGRRTQPKAKHEKLLQELFSISRNRFLGVAYRILQNQEDAEDAVQDAFLSASRHLGDFEGRSTVKSWFTRIVVNAALMMRRKRKNTFVWPLSDCGGDDVDFVETIRDFRPNPELACSRAESLAIVDALINEMNPLLRQAVRSTYYDELSSSEASSALAIPLSTYKARLFRGTHLLRARARRKSKSSAQ
jgi:RNA polymerase sigma-70 factor (ECF subfamily)